MAYCSLDDAFQEIGGAPSPGCATDFSTRASRKEERRRARKCKIPSAANFLQLESKDPDRQHLNRLPEPEVMNSSDVDRETQEAFQQANQWLHPPNVCKTNCKTTSPEFDKDPMDKYIQDEERGHLMALPVNGDHIINKRRFFGASGPDEEFFADYNPNQEDYRLQPDFTKAFEQTGLNRAGAVQTLPSPNMNVAWKPLSAGVPTSFYDKLTIPKGSYRRKKEREENDEEEEHSMKDVMKRIDTLFARLDDMNGASPEQMTSEMLMFISTGIFVMFMMDLLVKKGSTLRF
jgi:hypothetical protein